MLKLSTITTDHNYYDLLFLKVHISVKWILTVTATKYIIIIGFIVHTLYANEIKHYCLIK